ncbi:uncharacterized protein METZ01_LOCUS451715, partial [marine metagenome]
NFAQASLGLMFRKGQGVTQDYKEAVKLFRLAAEKGMANAQLNLGMMYSQGEGVEKDYKEAVKFYRLAAEQGDATAQGLLGAAYLRGEGIIQDYIQAHKWFNIAGANGDKLGIMGRDALKEIGMTPAQIAEAQKLAREWMKEHGKK